MIYQNFQNYSDIVGPVRAIAEMTAAALAQPLPGISRNAFLRAVAAICELIARAGLSHHRPAYGIDKVSIGGRLVAVREAEVHRTPFCTLLRFEKDLAAVQPPVFWWRRCRGISRRCCAEPQRHCLPITTSASPTGITLAMSVCSTAGSISMTLSTT
jgi:hypothetical protein